MSEGNVAIWAFSTQNGVKWDKPLNLFIGNVFLEYLVGRPLDIPFYTVEEFNPHSG
jgi:hypothetical protein